MAWRHGDTAAFNAVMTAGDKARAMYERYQAGQAYKEGTALTNPEDQATQEARRDVAADVAGPQPGQEFDSYDYQKGGLGATAPAQQEYTDAANRASQAATAGTKYYVGTGDARQAYDTAPTARQIHRGGLGAQAARLASMGDVEGAGRLQERIDAGEMHDLQRRGLEQTYATGERTRAREELETLRERTRDDVIAGVAKARELAKSGDYSGLQTMAKQYNLNLPGLDDGKTVHFLDGDGVAITNKDGSGTTRALSPAMADKMLDHVLSSRLAAISSKDWQHEREFQMKKGQIESEADYRKRMAGATEEKNRREEKQDRMEWGEVDSTGKRVAGTGWRGEYLKSLAAKASAGDKGVVTDVTWKDESGEVRTGKVGLERDGRRLKMYDIGTGKDIPTDDPRYQAMLSGVPKSAKNDPESNPEVANINAKVKKGDATKEDFARLDVISTRARIRDQFDTAASHDRNAAVVDLIRRLPSIEETPEGQSLALRDLGVTQDEADRARKYIKQGVGLGKGSIYRGVNRANQAATEADPSGGFQSEYLMRPER